MLEIVKSESDLLNDKNDEMDSGEIECQLGHFLDVKKRRRINSWHHHHRRYSTSQNLHQPINEIEVKFERSDMSVMSKNELYSIHGTSWLAAVLVMANCTIGMGLLNFPNAILRSGGILPATIVLTVVVILIVISLTMISYLARYYGAVTFQSVIGSHLGRYPRLLSRIFICINNFGALVIFLVVIGDQIEKVTLGIWIKAENIPEILHRRIMTPFIATFFIFPFCLLRRFDIFKYTSFLGVIAAMYVAFGLIVTRYFIPKPNSSGTENMSKPVPNLFKMIPLVCLAFECHIEIPPMIACLKRQSLAYCEKMIFGYVLLSGTVYLIGGIFGYLSFGDSTPDDILLAYDTHDTLVIVAFILLTLKIMTTYPVVFYCLRVVLQDILKPSFSIIMNDFFIRFTVSFIIFVPSVIIAIFVPSITAVINLIGGVSALFIFVFPGACVFKLHLMASSFKEYCLLFIGGLYIVIGVFLTSVITGHAINDYLI